MAWYDVFDESSDNWYGGDDDGWSFDSPDEDWSAEFLASDDWSAPTSLGSFYEYDNDWASTYDPYEATDSWYDNLGDTYSGGVEDRWDTSFGGQANNWTGVGTLLGNLKSGAGSYTKKGSMLGGLLGGKDGVFGGKDIMSLLGSGYGAYMKDRDNDRYNEMMQPMTDLYKAQAADVQSRRDNRDSNLASEYNTWAGMMQPGWDRRDQRAANLAQSQGMTQSSSNAWDKAASEQRRDLTKGYQQQQLANAYDQRTGMLGGQLSGLNPAVQSPGYLGRQENPYLQMLGQSVFFG
jgi:hypothetical protein